MPPITVQLPNGQTAEFPEGMSPQEIQHVIETDPNSGAKSPEPPTMLQKAFGANPLSDTASSIGSHLKNLVAGPYHAFTDEPQNAAEQRITQLPGNSGILGKIDLGAARMFAEPTVQAGREAIKQAKAGNTGLNGSSEYDAQGNYTPNALGSAMDAVPIAGPWARSVETEAHQKGALPALAGLATDVLASAGAGKIANTLRSAAPGVAEGALNIPKVSRAFGKTPGRAILDETKGVRPSTVQASAGAKLNELNSNIDRMAQQHPAPVDIRPAHDFIDQQSTKAQEQNNVGGVNAIAPVRAQLEENPFGLNQPFASPTVGNPNAYISPMQSAEGALNLKRGLRNQFVKNSWNPDAGPALAKDVARGASGVIDQQLDRALGPEFSKTNQRISSLIPVQDAAESVQRNASLGQRVGGRLKAHTGALTAGAFGASAGSHAFGLPGAVIGGGMGLLVPELLGSPTSQMTLARALDSTVPSRAAPVVAGGGILTPRGKDRQ